MVNKLRTKNQLFFRISNRIQMVSRTIVKHWNEHAIWKLRSLEKILTNRNKNLKKRVVLQSDIRRSY